MSETPEYVRLDLLSNCARCGGEHTNLIFLPLDRPCGELTHWVECPTNGQPILLEIKDND